MIKEIDNHWLAVKYINDEFEKIMGVPLDEFPDTPLTVMLYDEMEKFIELSVDNQEELESAATAVILANMEDILTGNW